jgi:hypothetical protein
MLMPISKRATGRMVELHILWVLVKRVGDLPEHDGFGVLDLRLGREITHFAAVTAVGTVAGAGPLTSVPGVILK